MMSTDKRRVLILEDESQTLKLLVDFLRSPHVELVVCSEIETAECLLDHEDFDVLVTDLEVSDLGGLEGIRLIRHVSAHFPQTTIVVFSGNISPEVNSMLSRRSVTPSAWRSRPDSAACAVSSTWVYRLARTGRQIGSAM